MKSGYRYPTRQRGGVFPMGTRVSYRLEVKMKAIEIRLAGVPVKEVMEEFNMQLKTWMRWYRNGELH